jgi:sugar O-acyltransferase (sialic acid O-acetyltransferase NeuD family)
MAQQGGKPLVIVGNSEIAVMAHEYFTHDSPHEVVGFCIGRDYIKSETFEGLPLVALDAVEQRFPPAQAEAFVAIGDSQLNRVRARHYNLMKSKGYSIASYVSSRAFVWRNVRLGENCFILEDNTIQPFVEIGDNVILWSGNHIGHRSKIHNHAFVSSHVVVSGFCSVGEYTFIGVNASIGHNVAIARDNYIAMAASVSASTEEDRIYQGNPAEARAISAKRFCRVKDA